MLDETSASDPIDEDLGAGGVSRDLTITGTPDVEPSLYEARLPGGLVFYQGGRAFDGATTYAVAGSAFAVGVDTPVFQSVSGEGYALAGWFKPASIGAQQWIVGYAHDSLGDAGLQQISVRVSPTGLLRTRWAKSGDVGVVASTTDVYFAVGVTTHWGVAVEPDPAHFNRLRVRFYIDGRCVEIVDNLESPEGGSSSRWWMGARPVSSSVPTDYLNGVLDDVSVLAFAAPTEWFRRQYARGVQDFQIATPYLSSTGRLSLAEEYEVHARVLVEDRLGALFESQARDVEGFVDMTNLYGWNWLLAVDIDENGDRQSDVCDVEFVTRYGEMSLAPEARTNGIASYFNAVNANDVLLTENNRVKVEVAVVPVGTGREGCWPHWMLRFDGLIAVVEAGDERTRVRLTDRMGALQDTWVEPDPETGEDLSYGSTPVGTPIEDVLQALIDDNDPGRYHIVSINDDGTGARYRARVLSTSSKPEPGKPHLFRAGDAVLVEDTTAYDGEDTIVTVTDTHITMARVGGALATESTGTLRARPVDQGYFGGRPRLYTPTSPLFEMFPFNVASSAPVSTWLEQISAQVGYSVRYAWDDEQQRFRLCLDRFLQVDLYELTLRRVIKVGDQGRDKENARTVLVGEYGEATDTDSTGNPRRRIVAEARPDSRERFGRRYARIGLASLDLVNTAAETQEMLDRVADDLDNPDSECELDTLYMPQTVVNGGVFVQTEMAEIPLIPRAFPIGRVLSIVAVRTTIDVRGARQNIRTRRGDDGVMRTQKHRELFQSRGYVKTLGLTAPATTGITGSARALSLGGTERGAFVSWTHPPTLRAAAWDFAEVHAGSSSGFTPSSSTLKATVRGNVAVVAGLATATTFHWKIVLRDRMANESSAIYLGSCTTA
jgi:hypothetical protein